MKPYFKRGTWRIVVDGVVQSFKYKHQADKYATPEPGQPKAERKPFWEKSDASKTKKTKSIFSKAQNDDSQENSTSFERVSEENFESKGEEE